MSRSDALRAVRHGFGLCALTLVLLLAASAHRAAATITVGGLAPGHPPAAICTDSPLDLMGQSFFPSYVVPSDEAGLRGEDLITSWSTNAAAGPGQMLQLKVFQTFKGLSSWVVASDGPRELIPGRVNTFSVRIPVKAGQILGLQTVNAADVPNACMFPSPGNRTWGWSGDSYGETLDLYETAFSDASPNVSVVIAQKPSNVFRWGPARHNKKKGTARISVDLSSPGTLRLEGDGLKPQPPADTAVKTVSTAGRAWLRIKPRGWAARRLENEGKLIVNAEVVFTPDGRGTGDLIGDPRLKERQVALVKSR
jgi:hypothetical protein